MTLPDSSPEKLTITVDDILNQIVSTVNNFFQYLITLFNKEYQPDIPRPWFDVAAPYLIAAAALITCLLVCHFFFWCISTILIRCFNCVCSCFPCFNRCLCCGEESDLEERMMMMEEERMMIAPGRSPLMLPRTAFEANPRGYFRDLRHKPNDFSYSVY